jgi:hypothetical protein
MIVEGDVGPAELLRKVWVSMHMATMDALFPSLAALTADVCSFDSSKAIASFQSLFHDQTASPFVPSQMNSPLRLVSLGCSGVALTRAGQ